MISLFCGVVVAVAVVVSLAATTTGIAPVFTSLILMISISRYLYLDNFSVNFAEVFLSDETVVSMSMDLLSFFSLTTMSGLLLLLLLLLWSSKNYLYAIQLKGTQGAKAWPVLRLVKLELKDSVQLKSKVEISICIYNKLNKFTLKLLNVQSSRAGDKPKHG